MKKVDSPEIAVVVVVGLLATSGICVSFLFDSFSMRKSKSPMDSKNATTATNTVNVNDCVRDLTIFHEVRSEALFEQPSIGGSDFSGQPSISVLGFGFSTPGALSRRGIFWLPEVG